MILVEKCMDTLLFSDIFTIDFMYFLYLELFIKIINKEYKP